MLGTPIHAWLFFLATLAALLTLDIGVLHRTSREMPFREALAASAAWIFLSLLFNLWVYLARGPLAGIQFLTGYLIEKSLSVDNIFVFLLIFDTFKTPKALQPRVLSFGVIGALVMRALFVVVGVELLQAFHNAIYILGPFLLLTGARLLFPRERVVSPEKSWLIRLARRWLPLAEEYHQDRFWVRREGRWLATPLLLVLITVELTDLVFAIDSVPAVLAVTHDAFIVYSSNAFAILGLRALYFALADALPRLRYLHQGLAAILIFVGLKMLASDWVSLGGVLSLGIVAGILLMTIGASLLNRRRKPSRQS